MGRGGSLLDISSHVEAGGVRPMVDQFVNHAGVAVEREHDGGVAGEDAENWSSSRPCG